MSKLIDKAKEEGKELTWRQTSELEDILEDKPFDYFARIKLMVFYKDSKPESYSRHYLWFINNAPEHEFLHDPIARWQDRKNKLYKQIKEQWVKIVTLPGVQPKTLSNIANYLCSAEPKLAIQYLELAKRRDPWNTAWQFELIEVYRSYSDNVEMRTCKQLLGKAIKCSEFLLRRKIANLGKVDVLVNIAAIAINCKQYDTAIEYSQKVVELKLTPEPNYDHTPGLHRARIIEAKVALEKGFVDAACYHLIESAKIPVSSIFMTYSPDFEVATRLLELDRQGEVIRYLELCRKFFDRIDLLDNWINQVKAGTAPCFEQDVLEEL